MSEHDEWMAGLGVDVRALKAAGAAAEGTAPGNVEVQPFHLQINLFNRAAAPLQLVSGSERKVPLVPPARYLSRPPSSIAPSGGGAFIITNEDPSGVAHPMPASGSIAYALGGDPDGAVFSLQWVREAGASAQSAAATVTPASAAARFEVQRDAGAAGQIAFQIIPVAAPQPRPRDVDGPVGKTVTLQISNRTGIPLAFNGSTWNSRSKVTFIKEPNSELAPGADFTGSMHFTTEDEAGQEIAQKFTFNYQGSDPSGAAVKASLGFSFVGGRLAPHCYIDPSPPYSHQDSSSAETVAFVLAQGVPDAPPVQPPAAPKKVDLRRCKLVLNQVDGPQNHVLCSVHGHVVDPGAGTEVAASIDEYHKIYWIGRPIADCQPDPGKLPHAPKNIVVCRKHGEVYDTDKRVVLANTRTMYLRAHPEHAGPAAKTGGEKGKGHKAMTTSASPDTPPSTAALGDLVNTTLAAARQLSADLEQYAGANWDDCEGCKLEAVAMVAALGPLVVGTATLTTALSVEALSVGAASGAAIPVACGAAMGAALGAGALVVAHAAYESCLEGRLAKAAKGSDARARIVAARQQLDALKRRIVQDQASLSASWEALQAGVRGSA
jgi:hypothetical protein